MEKKKKSLLLVILYTLNIQVLNNFCRETFHNWYIFLREKIFKIGNDAYFKKKKNALVWETTTQSSIPNVEILDVQTPRKTQRCELKKIITICLKHLVLFSMFSH